MAELGSAVRSGGGGGGGGIGDIDDVSLRTASIQLQQRRSSTSTGMLRQQTVA
jgi:hypothetical protein